ncbi:hypothetical protein GN958_ATG13139 [Phytophthora infestans]|uniref:RxLR effector protein n=1 Tax=Phytophthora infestans TaxID=4787 RepID=A0A8S9UDQ2_PHYIN|nr:hypothetical protein GN958_ATG13139 [Phytophthora infestans]
MRLSVILLLSESTALVASGSTLSIETDAKPRSLRSIKYAAYAEEERGLGFNASELKILKGLSNAQFHRMANDREYLKMIFTSWKQGMKSHEEAARYMRSEGVSDSAIRHFLAAYQQHKT